MNPKQNYATALNPTVLKIVSLALRVDEASRVESTQNKWKIQRNLLVVTEFVHSLQIN